MTTNVVASTPVTATAIEIVQGATFYMTVTWMSGGATPVPRSLAGFRAHMQIRKKAGAVDPPLVDARSDLASPDIEIEPLDNQATPQPQTGKMVIRIPATTTATLTKTCAYDLFIIDVNDDTEATRILFGAVTISRSVTVS